jgi:hypothetical protein
MTGVAYQVVKDRIATWKYERYKQILREKKSGVGEKELIVRFGKEAVREALK